MVVNKYSQYRPARYTPRTLQELMVVPAYKRQKHDQLQQGISTLQQQLNKYDNLDIHDPLVQAEKQRLQEAMNSQLEKLNSEGFNQSNMTDFINFNNDYQNAVGSEGVIGLAHAAKESYLKRRKELIDDAIKRGADPTASIAQLDRQFQQYADDFDGENITMFQGYNAPQKQDFMKDVKDFKSILGDTVKTVKGDERYRIIEDPQTGRLVIATESGSKIIGDNKDQLEFALSELENKWLTEGGEGRRWDEWNMVDPERRATSIFNSINMMRDTSVKDTRGLNYDWSSLKDLSDRKRLEGEMSYENSPVESYHIQNDNLYNALNKIGTEKTVSPPLTAKERRIAGISDAAYYKSREGGTFSFNDLTPSQKNTFNSIYEKLTNVGIKNLKSLEGVGGSSELDNLTEEQKKVKLVKAYLDYAQSVQYNNRLNTSPLVTVNDDVDGVKKVTPEVLANDINLKRNYRTFYDPEEKEYIKGEDLSDDINKAMSEGKTKVVGFYEPDNLWSLSAPESPHKSMLADKPIEMQVTLEDGKTKTLLVSQPSYKRSKGNVKFNEINTITSQQPGLPQDVNFLGRDVKIAKVVMPGPELQESNPELYENFANNYKTALLNLKRSLDIDVEEGILTPKQASDRLMYVLENKEPLFQMNEKVAGESTGDVFTSDDLLRTYQENYN